MTSDLSLSTNTRNKSKKLTSSLLRLLFSFVLIYTIVPWILYSKGPIDSSSSLTHSLEPVQPENEKKVTLESLEERIIMQSQALESISSKLQSRQEILEKMDRRLEESETSLGKLKRTLDEIEFPFHQRDTSVGIVKKIYRTLAPSSIFCDGNSKKDRICKFHNLYYYPPRSSYFALLTHESVMQNVPAERKPALLELVSIENHTVFYWDFDEVAITKFTNVLVEVVEKRTFMFSRFHVGNIMHSLHDDMIGLYHTIRKYAPRNYTGENPPYASFSLDHYIQFWDELPTGPYGDLFSMFTNHPLRYHSELHKTEDITCFADIVVGISKLANWYQYGFYYPQGPIKDKQVNGNYVRDVAKFIEFRLGLADADSMFYSPEPPKLDTLAIFSRTENRLIVNENDVLKHLSNRYNLKGQFIRMEDLDFRSQIKLLQRTKIALGMHGSLLIMAMFMRPGSVLIECYPFAVPAENYTPYKTLAGLPGMNIAYRSWENTHKDANFAYPDRDKYHGGIKHLSPAEQLKILSTTTVPEHICCTDPYWLFRIYQDTSINIDEVVRLIDSAMNEIHVKKYESLVYAPTLKPSQVDASTVKCELLKTPEGELDGVQVSWKAPWNDVEPEKYGVWEHIAFELFTTRQAQIVLRNPSYRNGTMLWIWISTYTDGEQSPYNEKTECPIFY